MKALRRCLLGDVMKFGNGKKRPTSEGRVPVYGGNGILGYAADSNYDGETIVIGRVGAYCGATYYENRPIWVSDNALAAKPKRNDCGKYLYFLTRFINLNQHAQGSSHPLVTHTLLNSIDVELIDSAAEQSRIAALLTSLEVKIDLLHRQNQTLESMAETLFRQWFVEQVEDDWAEFSVNQFADHLKTSVNPASEPETCYLHFSLPAFDKGKRPEREIGSQILSNKFKVEPWVVLVSKLNPRVPRIWSVAQIESGGQAVCSTEFQVLRPKSRGLFSYLYCLLASRDARDALTMAASGTSGSHQRVRPEDILNIKTSLPSIELAEEFSKLVVPLLKKQFANIDQVHALEKLRDTLLPKLMSGEVRVAC